ncbi:MAG: hypothetical protein ACN2B6_02415 [Rickettsiales bacterium]
MMQWRALLRLSIFLSGILITPLAQANGDGIISWHSTNIQLLRGHDYELGSQDRSLITFEHANGWTYGDFFMFVDYTFPDDGDTAYYAEFSPRFSLGKITGRDFSYGIIKDILVSTAIEKPKYQKARYLYGGAIDLSLPGFDFFSNNLYVRDDPTLHGKTWQVTLAWKRPFTIGRTSWVTEGFADFAGAEGGARPNQLIVPRLLLDVGALTNIGENKVWVGMEYSYWHNKFGVDGKTESVPQLQMKWVF